MLSSQSVQAYLRLHQILMASEDSKSVFNYLLPQVLLQLLSIGINYSFVDVLFLNEGTKVSQSYFADSSFLTTRVDLPPTIIDVNLLLDGTNDWEKELLWGRIYITSDLSLLHKSLPGVKTLILSPIMRANNLIGIFTLGTSRPETSITDEEKELAMVITNLVNFSFKIQDIENSLSTVTQEVYKMNSKLHDLDKLKDDFVSIASHELRTPMTAIRSYAWMALNRPDVQLTEKMKKYLQRTLVSTERLINLVNDMLNVSRIESGRLEITPQVMDLQNLMGEVLVEIDAKAKEKNLKIENPNTQIPKVFADPNKVHQVLLNILGNSLKFTKENGSIAISYFNDGYFLEVSIKDDGVGIAPEDLPRLFKKFSRLEDSYIAASSAGGTGLGLYICKSLIELMKGKIWVKSDGENKGTTFVFSLPIATPQVLKEAEKYQYKPDGEAKLLEPVAIQAYPNEPMEVVLK
jgi:signal transduction histidine kinase